MTISQLLIHMYLSAHVGALLSLLNCSVTYLLSYSMEQGPS